LRVSRLAENTCSMASGLETRFSVRRRTNRIRPIPAAWVVAVGRGICGAVGGLFGQRVASARGSSLELGLEAAVDRRPPCIGKQRRPRQVAAGIAGPEDDGAGHLL